MAQENILTKLFEQAEGELSAPIRSIIVRAYEAGYMKGLGEGRKIGMAEYHQRLIEHVTAPAANVPAHEGFTIGDIAEAEIVKRQRTAAIGVGMAVEKDEAPNFVNQSVFYSPTVTQTSITEKLAKEAIGRTPYGAIEELVLRVLKDATPKGLNGKEITRRIHQLGYYTVKEPSVRGRLRKLLQEGKVEKVGFGKLWQLPLYDL